jgi:hypothetical protein
MRRVIKRRYAVLGWFTWALGKRAMKKKEKKGKRGAIVLLVAAIGALAFWKKRSDGGDSPD